MSRTMTLGGLRLTPPVWAGDYFDRDALMPGGAKIDPTRFNAYTANVVVTLSADAAASATSIAVTALSGPIPSGTVLNFGLPGLFAITNGVSAAAATAIPVMPIERLIASGSTTTFYGSTIDSVPSGTLIGRTYAERAAGTAFGPAADGDDEIFLVAFDVLNVNRINDVELVRNGDFVVKENFLPDYSTILADAGLLAALRARYKCTIGQP